MTSRLLPVFQRSSRAVGMIQGGLRAVHDGLWLGCLQPSQLQQLTAAAYRRHGLYSNREYNRSGLQHWEAPVVDAFFGSCATVLIAACGGGREAWALAQRGCRCDGFDCAPELVSFAREYLATEGVEGQVLLAPPGDVPRGLGQYDGGIIGFGAYSLVPGRPARRRFVQAMAQHVRPGGPVMLSFTLRDGTARAERLQLALARGMHALRRRSQKPELGDTLLDGFCHNFTLVEVEQELAAAGFTGAHLFPGMLGVAVFHVPADAPA